MFEINILTYGNKAQKLCKGEALIIEKFNLTIRR